MSEKSRAAESSTKNFLLQVASAVAFHYSHNNKTEKSRASTASRDIRAGSKKAGRQLEREKSCPQLLLNGVPQGCNPIVCLLHDRL